MIKRLFPSFCLLQAALLLILLGPGTDAQAKTPPLPDHWVGTWTTAAVDRNNADGKFGAEDTTLRQIVHVSLGGPLVRIELSNEFGTEPLTIGSVHVALSAGKDGIQLPSANALTFGGQASVTLPPGARVVSDPAALALPAFADLAISLFVPAQKISHVTTHGSAFQTNYRSRGNQVGLKTLGDAAPLTSWFFLKAVDVKSAGNTAAVVAFGDSITDGTASTIDANSRWPDLLARRLQANKKTAGLSVLNVGIGGNRVLHEVSGPSALTRFDVDVLAQSGVRYMVLLEGINDIGHAADPVKPYDVITAADLIAGLTQLVERAHMHGIKVLGATLTPYAGAKYASPAGEAMRQAVNQWIRTGNVVDGVIDFDAVTRDQSNPASFAPAYDHGDHLHPTDAGMKAMADSIDLKLFVEKK